MAKAMKYSKQREALVQVLRSTRTHPTADWLYHELRKEQPSISLGTVYRNLKLLADSGEILRLDVGSGIEHYDAFTHDHHHFVCRCCERVLDLDIPELESLDQWAGEACGHQVESHSLIFYGICSACQ